jgi:leucyl-tRNA synthetase
MFMGPLEVSKPWNSAAVTGARKFIGRVYTFFTEPANITEGDNANLEKVYHQTVKKVSGDFEELGFNTAIAQMMIFVNACYKTGSCPKEYAEGFVKMLSCISPHICEEIFTSYTGKDTVAYEPWPSYSEEALQVRKIEIAVQVNGKLRSTIVIPLDSEDSFVVSKALEDEKVQRAVAGMEIVKKIVVKNRIVNLIVKPSK